MDIESLEYLPANLLAQMLRDAEQEAEDALPWLDDEDGLED